MMVREVACTSCRATLPPDLLDGAFHMCPACLNWIRVHLFPAFNRQESVQATESPLVEGQSSCFYHPHKTAVVPCESCGRFLCALCDIEIGGVHRCPRCLESGRRKQQLQTLQTEHIRYDRIALALTTITLLIWPFTLITAPAALFIVIRYWKRRSKVLPGGSVGYVVAGLLAVAELSGWAFLFYLGIHGWRT
jgi:hypothetical protein